ncbi:MAG TPA: group II truncated hemoglobin [Burkholderiales bacterium]|nr:group II truncated hemoglobin [Burkholderiales bacterium]
MSTPSPETPYQRIGGEAGVRRLVHRFYKLMDELPEAYGIRKLHPADLSSSEQKLFEFFSGWLGGPPLFEQKHGPVFLRRRHFPFAIGGAERDQWMLCMRMALEECVGDAPLRARLQEALAGLADHMRNRPEAE